MTCGRWFVVEFFSRLYRKPVPFSFAFFSAILLHIASVCACGFRLSLFFNFTLFWGNVYFAVKVGRFLSSDSNNNGTTLNEIVGKAAVIRNYIRETSTLTSACMRISLKIFVSLNVSKHLATRICITLHVFPCCEWEKFYSNIIVIICSLSFIQSLSHSRAHALSSQNCILASLFFFLCALCHTHTHTQFHEAIKAEEKALLHFSKSYHAQNIRTRLNRACVSTIFSSRKTKFPSSVRFLFVLFFSWSSLHFQFICKEERSVCLRNREWKNYIRMQILAK